MRLFLDRRIRASRRRIRIRRGLRRQTTERCLRLSIPSPWRTSGSTPEVDTPSHGAGTADCEDTCRRGDALTAGGVRELHWHVPAEWAMMLYGHARITAVDQQGRSLSMTSVRATSGSSQPEYHIRSKVWARTAASFCWSSTMAISMNSRLS